MRKQTLVSHIYWIRTYAEVNSAFKSNHSYHRELLFRVLRSRTALTIVGLTLIIIGIAVILFGQNSDTPSVEASTVKQKYYTSIEVENGDTLWSLAEEYGERYHDHDVFIKEVRSINKLEGDHITAGASLLIPVYR